MKKISELFSKINNFLNKNHYNINNPPAISFSFNKNGYNIYISLPGFYMSFVKNDVWSGVNFSEDMVDFSIRISDINNVFATMKNNKTINVARKNNNIIFSSDSNSSIEIPIVENIKSKSFKKCKSDCINIPNIVMDSVLYRARACFYTHNHTPIYNTFKIISKDGYCKFVSGNGSLFCIQKMKCSIKDGTYCVPYSCLSFLHELNKIVKSESLMFRSDANSFYVENDSFIIYQESDLDYIKWPDENKILEVECEINCIFSSELLKSIRDNLQLSMLYKKDDELLITNFCIDKSIEFETLGKIKTNNNINYISSNKPYKCSMYTRLLLDLVNSMPDSDVEISIKTSLEEFKNKRFPIVASFLDVDAEVNIICSLV